MSLARFDDVEQSNAGVRVELGDGDWLVLRNYRCDAHRTTYRAIQKRIAEHGLPDDAQAQDDRLTLLASLVGDWSEPQPCTADNIKAVLARSSRLCEAIDRFAVDDGNFFANASPVLSCGPSAK